FDGLRAERLASPHTLQGKTNLAARRTGVLAIELLREIAGSKWFEFAVIVVVATFHGWGAAWLAVRMLFRPHKPFKVLGLTVWPQGMIPRHREKLAQSIGKAVGSELMSQETVVSALFDTDFFRRKVEGFVNSYAADLLNTPHPSFIEALPRPLRASVLDAVSSLQMRVAEYVAEVLRSEETAEAVARFIDHRVDEILSRRLGEAVGQETFDQALGFVETRLRGVVAERGFEQKVRDFVSARVDELAASEATLAEMFTPESVAVIKERIDQQVPPIVRHLTEIATNRRTRTQIGALIKREVDDYYQQLSFFKKIFISRERIHTEVDDLVNKTLPRRVEEFLSGEAFEQQAEEFLDSTIDNVLARPLRELVGQVEPEKLQLIKDQVASRILALARSTELATSVSSYASDALHRVRPHTLRAIIEHAQPDSAERLKDFLSRGMMGVLSSEETARTLNSILSAQVERLLIAPIGRISDHLPEEKVERATTALTERITAAARERLPVAIAEFDIGGLVRQKVTTYPVEKLEELVLSVAKQHLRTIEMFGLVLGFLIGVVQAALIYFGVIGAR
ncbi:MAG TPA: DUF445 family protein, partial [Pyrinomonadaceae bacterium]|nr:DUF445 family protein [Pyrinomonadaceae bacterium]